MKHDGFLAVLVLSGLFRVGVPAAADQPRPFNVFGFGGLESMAVSNVVDLLMDLDYAGILPRGREPADLVRYQEYLDRADSEGDDFNVLAYYLNHKVYNDGYDDTVHRQVIDTMAARGGGTMWMAVRAAKKPTDPVDYTQVDNFIKGVFDYATGEDAEGNYRNVNIVFYPPVNNAYESPVEALPLVEEINAPRFTVSINLVHEYHAGLSDPASLSNTFAAARGRIGAVVLCGIQTNGFHITSLENSEHDLKPFLEIVSDSEYNGEIAFINFNTGPLVNPSEYLAGSMTEWRTLSTNAGLFAEAPAPFVMGTEFSGGDMVLHWNSKLGKFYNLYSSTNLVDWAPYSVGTNTYADIPASGLGTNALPVQLTPGDARFFKLQEDLRPAP